MRARSVVEAASVVAVVSASVMASAASLSAQASADLRPVSRTEHVIEKLVGFGLVDDRLYGIRPWSNREAQRIFDQARANLTRLAPEDRRAAQRILSRVSGDDLGRRAGAELLGGVTMLDSPWLAVPDGLGQIDAELNHLVRHRGGREYLDGETAAAEITFDARLGSRIAVQATPRLWVGSDAGDETLRGGQLLDAQLRVGLGGLLIDAGRLRSVWGPGRDGGSLLSGNARGLDGMRFSTDGPFSWPGFLSFLGPSQAELFLSILEQDRDIPRSRVVGYKLSVRPHRLVEASFSTLIQSGGSGAPDASAWERIADHVLLIDWIFNGGETFLFSNKGSSVGLRVRVPPLRQSQLFLEFTLEDKGHNPTRIFWQDAAWLVGMWVPRLNRSGSLDLRVELHHSGVRFHRHSQFTSGRTLDGRILGMGAPATDGGFVEVGADDGGRRLSFHLAVENRSNDVWGIRFRDDGGIDVLDKTEDRPDELYLRGVAALSLFQADGRELRVGVGVERVSDSLFQDRSVRHDGLLEITARLPFAR